MTTDLQPITFNELKQMKQTKLLERQIKASVKLTKFMEEFKKHGVITRACKTAGIKYDTVNNLRRKSPAFAYLLESAAFEAKDHLEYVAYKRAVEGWEEDIVFMGRKTGDTVKKVDNKLLLELLRAAKPEKFSSKSEKDININITNNISAEQAHELLLKKLSGLQEKPINQDPVIEGEFSEVTSGS